MTTKSERGLTGPGLRIFGPVLAATLLLAMPRAAWAIQTHGAPEGLYVHQMAHLFFAGSLVYFHWIIRRNDFTGRGWRYLQLFCICMICWNLLTFTGHAMNLLLTHDDFSAGPGLWHSRMLGPITPVKWTYYLAKLDHLICVPALLFLYLSLRAFYHDETEGEEK